MPSTLDVFKLSREPTVRVRAAPELDAATQRVVEECRRQINLSLENTDGPKLLVMDASPEEVTVYRTTYAARLAHNSLADESGRSPLGLGSLACRLLLRDARGGVLLGKRSAGLALYPDHWDIAVGGGVDPGVGPRDAVITEAEEELGLSRAALTDLKPVALCIGAEPLGCSVIYQALIAPGHDPRGNPLEVAAVRWHLPSQELPTPAVPLLAELVRLGDS